MEKIAIGSDHAAYQFKEEMKAFLLSEGYEVKDMGAYGPERVDYPDFGISVGETVARGEFDKGIVFCGTGVGMAIAANKVKGIRAVVCTEPYSARLSRLHNDTNVLALGARVVGPELAKMIIKEWLTTGFEGGRHYDRIMKIARYEENRG
jgi:ribose 5-phosphate isomerase B